MIRTHSYEDRQSLLETGVGEYKNQNNNNNNNNKNRKRDRRRGQRGQRWGVDGGAVRVRKGGDCVCVCVRVCVCMFLSAGVCVHVAEVRRN